MKKITFIIASLIFSIFVGCGGTTYNTAIIGMPIEKETTAIVKTEEGLFIWKVDDQQLMSHVGMNSRFGNKINAIKTEAGKHDIYLSYHEARLHITADLKGGHEYIVNYNITRNYSMGTIKIWMKDLTEDKIVVGEDPVKK